MYYHYGYEKKDEKPTEVTASSSNSTSEIADNESCTVDSLDSEVTQIGDCCEKENDPEDIASVADTDELNDKVAEITMEENAEGSMLPEVSDENSPADSNETCSMCRVIATPLPKISPAGTSDSRKKLFHLRQFSNHKPDNVKRPQESGLFLYIDFHGHASKKGKCKYARDLAYCP